MKEMIKQKMMKRLHRRNSSSSSTASIDYTSGERIEFSFSGLQALQVPKGWDKLSLSLISVETGKTIAKTGRASVQNGICRWTENLSERIWVPNDDASKGVEQCLYKLFISMGSSRSGILGEVTVNLSSLLNSETSTSIAQPLKNCSHGTILQVEIQCLTPRANLRWTDTDSFTEDATASDDLDNTSDASDSRITKSLESSISSNFQYTSQAGGLGSRDRSLSGGGSRSSFDSMDDSFGREISSPHRNQSEVTNDLIGRQDYLRSSNSSHDNSYNNVYDSPKLNHSLYSSGSGKNGLSQRQDSGKISNSIPASPLRASGPTEFAMEAEGPTVEELRAESRMWERKARKLMVDLDFTKKESRDQMKKLENATMEVLSSRTECDGLKNEINYLKVLLDESAEKVKAADGLKIQVQDKRDIQIELEEEMKFQKDLNDNLSLQLNRTQESNLELVSILQELEETIEKQRLEIESLKDSEKEKTREIEREKALKAQTLLDNELEWKKKLSLKNEEILNLEEKLSKIDSTQLTEEIKSDSRKTPDLNEVKALKDKIQELERDCNELTEENLELLFKLKESNKDLSTNDDSGPHNIEDSKVRELESQIQQLKEAAEKRELEGIDAGYLQIRCNDLESKCVELEGNIQGFKDKACYLDDELNKFRAKAIEQENEVDSLKQLLKSQQEGKYEKVKHPHRNYSRRELEAQLSELQILKTQLNGSLKAMQSEGTIIYECLDKLKNDLAILKDTKDSQIAANKILENKLLEVESCNKELELHLTELESENLHLSDRISGLESQLRYMTEARESTRLEMQHSETRIENLQAKIKELEDEIETSKVDTRQKLQDMQKRWLEAQEECEYLKKANPKLQTTAESLIEECSQLEKSNRELKQQRLDLYNRNKDLEAKLRDSEHNFSKLLQNLEELEDKFSLMVNEIATKEEMFVSELGDIHLENKEQNEKFVMGENLFNQMYSEKMVEIDSLQQEVAHLSTQIYATQDERDRMASDAVLEMHILRAEKDKLENAFEEVKEKFRSSEKKLEIIQDEYEAKVQDLKIKLAASKQNHEVLTANLEKIMGLLENSRSDEEKLRVTISELHGDLKDSEYKGVQLTEEISSLKDQLQKIPLLQDEVVALKNSQNSVKYENERLEASLQIITGDYEKLKEEKTSLFQRTSSMQKAMMELEDLKRDKVALEEQIMRLQGDLTAREALCAQDAELKNQLGRLKRSNSHLQWKINHLRDEKDECVKNAQILEEKLEQKKDDMNSIKSFGSNSTSSLHEYMKFSESVEVSRDDETTMDAASRIQSLETELAEALEANETYKSQIKSFGMKINKEHDKDIQTELKALEERYLHMSLKYAEVEAEREELVSKLKAAKPGKSWFS